VKYTLFLLFTAIAALGQGSVVTGVPTVTNALGQPLAGTTVAVCTADPGSPTVGGCAGTLATLYTDITIGTPCTGTAKPLSNPGGIGTGCSNPGTTDGNGNAVAFAVQGQYWCEFYGGPISGVKVLPCVFPTTASAGSFTFINVTASGTITAKTIEDARYVDHFANIQAAITDAGTTGIVIIPANYAGTDTYSNPNNIVIWDHRRSTYANLLKFSTFGLALNSGNTLNEYGDSITVGSGATTPTTGGYAYLLGSSFGYANNNQAVSGTQVQDAGQIDKIYATAFTQTSTSLWLPAFNDMRLHGTSATPLATAKNTILAGAIHAAIPDSYRVAGTAAGCVKTGTWATNTGVYSSLPVVSTTNGDTVSCANIRGSTIYVVSIGATAGGGAFSVTIDGGAVYGPYSLFTFSASNAGRTYMPFVVRIPNQTSGPHTVLITVTSATNIANSVNVVEVAGNGGASDYAGPSVYLGEVLHMTAAGYALSVPFNNGSDNAADAYTSAIRDVCRQLGKEDHLGVFCVDTGRYNPTLDVSADNIHPSDQGHQHIADTYICRMTGTSCPIEKSAITTSGVPSFLPIYAPLPNNYGAFFACMDSSNCQIASNRDPVTGKNLNPAVAGFAINFDSSGNAIFYSTSSGYTGTPTQQFAVNASGGITIASGAQIKKHLSATASLDFAAWGGTDCQDLTVPVTGAADGDSVEIGVPLALSSTAGVQFTGFVSAADTVTIRGCKITAGASANPAAATVRADVWKH
jgi:hypothetical protein